MTGRHRAEDLEAARRDPQWKPPPDGGRNYFDKSSGYYYFKAYSGQSPKHMADWPICGTEIVLSTGAIGYCTYPRGHSRSRLHGIAPPPVPPDAAT